MKRSGKFYRTNETEVMLTLGLQPTINSGSGWIEKEDGQSEDVICQLKSTDANSIRVHQNDFHTLEYNATVSHKLPVFAIQFLNSNEVYLIIKPEHLSEAAEYIKTGEYTTTNEFVGVDLSEHENVENKPNRTIKSSSNARERFSKEWESKFKKKEKPAT